MTALADLSDAHIHVLQTVASPDDEPTALHIRELSGLPSRIVGLCLAGLISGGLVEATTGLVEAASSMDQQNWYGISELGRTLLEVLSELETDSDR